MDIVYIERMVRKDIQFYGDLGLKATVSGVSSHCGQPPSSNDELRIRITISKDTRAEAIQEEMFYRSPHLT